MDDPAPEYATILWQRVLLNGDIELIKQALSSKQWLKILENNLQLALQTLCVVSIDYKQDDLYDILLPFVPPHLVMHPFSVACLNNNAFGLSKVTCTLPPSEASKLLGLAVAKNQKDLVAKLSLFVDAEVNKALKQVLQGDLKSSIKSVFPSMDPNNAAVLHSCLMIYCVYKGDHQAVSLLVDMPFAISSEALMLSLDRNWIDISDKLLSGSIVLGSKSLDDRDGVPLPVKGGTPIETRYILLSEACGERYGRFFDDFYFCTFGKQLRLQSQRQLRRLITFLVQSIRKLEPKFDFKQDLMLKAARAGNLMIAKTLESNGIAFKWMESYDTQNPDQQERAEIFTKQVSLSDVSFLGALGGQVQHLDIQQIPTTPPMLYQQLEEQMKIATKDSDSLTMGKAVQIDPLQPQPSGWDDFLQGKSKLNLDTRNYTWMEPSQTLTPTVVDDSERPTSAILKALAGIYD
ncbi:hypothetical protein EDD86DRAFT_245336 [Gorgonomyces haynaldii]|nr:hypothetical protein EDD86DRAFT_245336 [Gorgonomyces haynaldii]